MKRSFLVPLCGLTLMITPASGQESPPAEPSVIVVPTLETEVPSGKVVAWSAAMPAMWRELCDHLGTEKIVLTPESKLANDLNAWRFNPSIILPKDGSVVLSGNGTKTSVQAARDQLKQKFNDACPELEALLQTPADDSWFALCMLRQSLRFEPEFIPETEWAMLFKNSQGEEHAVKCFGTPADEADRFSKVVQVLRYKSPHTILSIKSSIPGEHLFLCMMMPKEGESDIPSMAKTVEEILLAKADLNSRLAAHDIAEGHFSIGDLLEIPEVHFSGEAQHLGDLKGTFQVPGKAQPQQFIFASHRVQFDMNAKGVKIEARAGAGGGFGGPPPKQPHTRAFVFDRPFFIIAWRDDAPSPYFAAFIDDAKALVESSGYTGGRYASLPSSFRSRCSVAERVTTLKECGGTAEQLWTISRGFEYLKSIQNPDGSWGDDASLEITSLALLAYLAGCETPESPFYGDNITRTVLWLVEQLKRLPPEQRSLNKEVALATQALGEVYALSKLGSHGFPGLRDRLEASISSIIERQLPNGTWAPEDEEGYLITGHCIQALLSARVTALKIEGLRGAQARIEKFFMESAPPQNLAPEVAILRAAIAVNACVSRSTLAEPANSETTAMVNRYRDLATAAKFSWTETSSLEHWLLFPAATIRYPDLTKALMQGAAQEITKAQGAGGSIKSGPTLKTTPTLSAREMELRRTIVAILTAGLPYRWRISPQNEGSVFDRR